MKTNSMSQNQLGKLIQLKSVILFVAYMIPLFCVGQGRSVTLSGKAYDVIDTILLDKKPLGDYVVVLYETEASASPLLVYSYKRKVSYYHNAVLTCRYCFGKVGTNVPTLHSYSVNNRTICFRQDIFGRYDSIFVDFSADTPYVSKVIIHHWTQPTTAPHNINERGSAELTPRKRKTRLDAFSPPIDLEDPETKRLFQVRKIRWRKID